MLFHIYICFLLLFSLSLTSWTKHCYALIETCDVVDGFFPCSGDMTIKKRGAVSPKFLPLLFTKNSTVETCLICVLCGLYILILLENVINHHFRTFTILSLQAAKFSISLRFSLLRQFYQVCISRNLTWNS